MHPEPGAVIAGRYRLEGPLSRGGMGSIWLARHLQLGSRVAVKFMDPAYAADPSYRTRFAREAQAAASLRSPHIVQVHDYGIEGDLPYLAMELLEGEDLHSRLSRQGRLPLAEAVPIAVQIGKALRRAHELRIIHRDLKPRNIFLARVDEDEIVKILDFGIAKQIGGISTGQTTKTGEILGTPHFMSPEQLRAERDLDMRTDLWSFGVILFRAITGRLPFEGEVLSLVLAKILVDPIPSTLQLAPDLPPGMDAFFARALARDRDQRFSSAQEMVDAFARLAAPTHGVGPPVPVMRMLGDSASVAGEVRSARPRARLGPAIAVAGGLLGAAALALTLLRLQSRDALAPSVEPIASPASAASDPPVEASALAVATAEEAAPALANAPAFSASGAVAGAPALPPERPAATGRATSASSAARPPAPREPRPAVAPPTSAPAAPAPATSDGPSWGF